MVSSWKFINDLKRTFNPSMFSYNKIEICWGGEVTNNRMGNGCWFVSCYNIGTCPRVSSLHLNNLSSQKPFLLLNWYLIQEQERVIHVTECVRTCVRAVCDSSDKKLFNWALDSLNLRLELRSILLSNSSGNNWTGYSTGTSQCLLWANLYWFYEHIT